MKRILTLISLALIFLIADVSSVFATHAAGADITYRYNGNPNEFLVTVKFYRDCAGTTAPTAIDICYSSVSCGVNTQAPAALLSTQVLPNPPCVSSTINCAGGFGVEEYVYQAVITLPSACTDWIFSYSLCCRNNAITTLVNPGGLDINVEAKLDNVNYPTDNSPEFLTVPYTQFCVGNPFFFDQQAQDIDGDSLTYSLVNPLMGACAASSPITNYVTATPPELPLSPTQPVFSNTPVTINSQGVIYFLPTSQQVAVLAVIVREFEHGTGILKGSVRRDIQINVTTACNYIVPEYQSGLGGGVNGGTGLTGSCGSDKIIIPFGTEFQCGSAAPSDFRVLDPFGFANPVIAVAAVNCTNGKTDSVELTLLHTFTNGTSYIWTKVGADGNTLLSECGLSQPEDDTIKVKVDDTGIFVPATDSIGCLFNQVTIDLSESVFCFSIAADGSDLTLIDGGTGNSLPIANTYGYCGPGGDRSNQVLITMTSQQSILGPAYLIANQGSDNNTIADDCGRFLAVGDTVAILYVNNIIPVTLGSDANICDAQVPLTLNSGYTAPATFTWSQNGSVINGATSPSYDAVTSGVYDVLVYSSATCFGRDTVVVNVLTTAAPYLGTDTTFCQGGAIGTLDPGTGDGSGYAYAWFYNSNLIFLANDSVYTPPATQYGCYTVEVNNQQTCFAADTVCFFSVQPPVNNLSSQAICVGDQLPTLDAGNAGAQSFQWFENNVAVNGANSQFYTVTNSNVGATDYSVAIVNGGVCNGTFSMTLTIAAVPVVAVASDSACVGSTSVVFDAQNSGASYNWMDNNGTTVGSNQQFTPSVTTPLIYDYSVVVTNSAGCSATSSFQYTINSSPAVSISDDSKCETEGPVLFDATNAGTDVSFLWSDGSTGSTLSASSQGTYVVTVTNVSGCTASEDAFLSVESLLDAPVVNCGLGNASFKYIYSWTDIVGNTGYQVSEDGGINWITPVTVGGAPTTHSTNAIITNLLVRALNSFGLCKQGKASEPVLCAPILPNIITANGDNKNDGFLIANIEFYPNNKLTIFNRWGKEVFSRSKYNNKDGVFKGEDLPEGTYFVILDLGDGRDALTGTLTIAK
ncbi:MAG: gliding motility-associated C-terminal domain-containing protein [Bacteroidota bacterium]